MVKQDLRVILDGLQKRVLTVDQACALFTVERDAATNFLMDRLKGILQEAEGRRNAPRTSASSVPILALLWKLLGPKTCIGILPAYDFSVVDTFFKGKLAGSLDEFSDEDLLFLEEQYRSKPLIAEDVRKARARLLVPVANQLLRNPTEINRDVIEVKGRISAYRFSAQLNEALDKVEEGLAANGDPFDQAALLKHLRTFFEKLHEQVATKLRQSVPGIRDNANLAQCGQAIDYLERHGVLTERMKGLARALYGVLSEEGVHSLKSAREYVRFGRNWAAEYALVLFFELDRRLGI